MRQCDTQAVAAKIEVFDWLAGRKDKRIQRNPAGYLVESIRQDYAPPKGFEPKAVREARAARAGVAPRG